MSLILYRKPDPSRRKPSAALYIAFFLLSFLTINTYYLVFGENNIRYILWTFLAAGYLISIYAHIRFRSYLDILINLLALVFFAIYFRQMIGKIDHFGSILGQLLAVLLVLRSYILFNRDDFFVPLVVSMTIILLCSIPSYESNYIISLQVYFFVIIACLYLLTKAREIDESRLGYFELEKIKKSLKPRREIGMLVLYGVIALLISTTVYLIIPHQAGINRRYTALYRNFFGKKIAELANRPNPDDLAKISSPNEKTETYVGFDENNFTITHGKTIREGDNANDVVMEVQMDYPRYMRAMVWDEYTGGEWKRTGELSQDWELHLKHDPILMGNTVEGVFELQESREVYVDELKANKVEYNGSVTFVKGYNPSSFLFLPWETTSLKIGIDDLWTNASSEIKLKDSKGNSITHGILAYHFTASSYMQSGMEATYLRERSTGHFLERYTQLPESIEEPINGRTIRDLAWQIARQANATTDYEKTITIQKYLKSVGKYSTSPPYCPPEYDVISYFILEVNPKKGHCEIFSSAMAVMLRSLDVPCRIATGYSPGTYAFNRNSYIIREKNAHAWVEVYFPEIGWIEFDPTPNTLWNDTKDRASEVAAVASSLINELYVYSPRQFYTNRIRPFTKRTISLYYFNSGRVLDSLNTWFALELIFNLIIAVVLIASIMIVVLIVRNPPENSAIFKRKSRVYYSQLTETLRQKGNRIAIGATPTEMLMNVRHNYPASSDAIERFLTDFWILNYAPRYLHKDVFKRIKRNYRKAIDSLRKATRIKN